MAEAYLIDAVRTPVGKRGGGLAGVHSADLGAHVIKGLTERNDFDPGAVEDVIFGCCDTIGSQAGDIARTCWLAAGLPDHVPGVTIDRQCGSSQQSVHFAAQAVMSGTSDLIVAGGVQNMSQIPISSAMTCAESLGFEDPFSGVTTWKRWRSKVMRGRFVQRRKVVSSTRFFRSRESNTTKGCVNRLVKSCRV